MNEKFIRIKIYKLYTMSDNEDAEENALGIGGLKF
jgi:hypothetical protein